MEDDLKQIQERNQRVEVDKAWETSWTRRGVIAVITYAIAVLFMHRIGVPDAYLNALVPTGGFIVSTLSLSMVKKYWVRKYERN